MEAALADAKLGWSDVHAVELMGGGTRIPRLQTLIRERLVGAGPAGAGLELGQHLNTDEAAAQGAAFIAANMR